MNLVSHFFRLFRLSANKQQLDEMRNNIDKGGSIDITEIEDPHLITGIIKLFLRSLPEPLLTFQLYQEFVEVAGMIHQNEKDVLFACFLFVRFLVCFS